MKIYAAAMFLPIYFIFFAGYVFAQAVSGGVVNGPAASLPKPAYPPAAKAVRASGKVNVQVAINEEGKIVEAVALSGHPLLRAAAVSAAKAASFSPTFLNGNAVKVTGILVYNFVLETNWVEFGRAFGNAENVPGSLSGLLMGWGSLPEDFSEEQKRLKKTR